MEQTQDIGWLSLMLGIAFLVIPVSVLWYYRTGLALKAITAAARMTIQLLLVGFYLQYLFRLNSAWVNISWMLLMFVVAAFTTTARNGFRFRISGWPAMAGMAAGVILADAFLLIVALRLENFFDARYFIALTGMMTGNCMERNIIALNTYYSNLRSDSLSYRYEIASGARRSEALRPYIREAMRQSFNPLIAQMAVMGLISLPGTMTGQILGGSDPAMAIRYQILIMISIFTATVITVALTLRLANRLAFDAYDNLKEEKVFKKKPQG